MGCYPGGTAICPFFVKEADKKYYLRRDYSKHKHNGEFKDADDKRKWLEGCCSRLITKAMRYSNAINGNLRR